MPSGEAIDEQLSAALGGRLDMHFENPLALIGLLGR